MGSNIAATAPSSYPYPLPDASSPELILTHPTPTERTRTWRLTHPKWGPALSEKDYLAREAYLTTVPLARDGGITHWILTIASLPPDERPVLSSCESTRKRAVVARDGRVEEGAAHGVGSVFTDPQFRGKGYASRMMSELGERLRKWQVIGVADRGDGCGDAQNGHGNRVVEHGVTAGKRRNSLFSVLYSDIGKKFYARHGWAPFASSHVAFQPRPERPQDGLARPIGYYELAELCYVDEKLLRADLARRPAGRTHVALLPELDVLLWHLMREDFMTKCIFGHTPTVRGAVAGEPGRRVWAVWMRGYYGGLKKLEGNTLHVLRVVVEDEEQPDEELADGFRSIVQIAQAEAAEWKTQDVQVWNPTPKLRGLIESCGIEYEFVDRDKESIASLMWYGEESTAELDWVANEKYAWC
ncbi:Lysine acetyltransferase [Madurella mycetomatis]|uniref:Lysine acetyltransferase n=1 Tax=Madurella mycetomatis TaxID=100816 RepID=A0A175VY48_9PEZI|nr:Lysine acetyltransferase [Madurella mycetomatis]